MRIAICDDDLDFQYSLISYIRDFNSGVLNSAVIDTYSNTIDFLAGNICYDILFMDVFIGNSNGIETVSSMKPERAKCVVFITMSKDFAIEAYKMNAVHYLVKPITKEMVDNSLSRCFERIRIQEEPFLTLTYGTNIVNINYKLITYINSSNKRTLIHTDSNTYTTYLTLDNLMKTLDDRYFMRVQRSYIVNMGYISDFTAKSIVLENGNTINLSRRNNDELKKQFENYLFNLARRTI